MNPNFKIYIFIIINNTLFDLELEDKADFPTYYQNEIKKQITQMKKSFDSKMNNMNNDIIVLKKEVAGMKS